MDRNLGASRVATSSTDSAAYGDLYQWGRATDGHEKRTSGVTTELNGGSADAPIGNSVWRLPTEAEWEAERSSWDNNNAAGAFGSVLKLAMAGFRDNSSGSLSNIGVYGGCWSSTLDGIYSRFLDFSGSSSFMNSFNRSIGGSVRLIKDI